MEQEIQNNYGYIVKENIFQQKLQNSQLSENLNYNSQTFGAFNYQQQQVNDIQSNKIDNIINYNSQNNYSFNPKYETEFQKSHSKQFYMDISLKNASEVFEFDHSANQIDDHIKIMKFEKELIKEETGDFHYSNVFNFVSKQQMINEETGNFERKMFDPNSWSLNDFIIVEPLGQGKFGRVYLARSKQDKYWFAIKSINKQSLTNSNLIRQFRNEIEIQSRLKHRNVLQMYGWFQNEKKLYFILEYAPGGELYKLLKKQPNSRFDESTASKYIYQIAQALKYIHSKNIIHRDIKPENILVCDGIVKLADFGWSVHAPNQRRKTMCGTCDYLCPEMIEEQEHDHNVDIWTLGVLCYELCTGNAPFFSKNQNETKKNIKNVKYIFPKYLSQNCRNLIENILVKDKNQRLTLNQILAHDWILQYN